MRKKTILIIVILFLMVMVLQKTFIKKRGKVCFKDNCFNVDISITLEERSRGLMFKESLDINQGMLFIFDKNDIHSFWMKNTLISLDIIWINEEKEIVFIKEMASPCEEKFCTTINPLVLARYALEINGGLSRKIGLQIGDKISIEY